ncbi:MAG: hypothetical protein HFG27_08630, partial [Provencibacterium sp.]|nr:hypothetical protein [Provencibacterium sp.]
MAYAPASLIKGAPDWHEIVNANFTAIAAALANKANAESVYKALTAPEEDLLEWALQQEQGGYFNVTADITGTP